MLKHRINLISFLMVLLAPLLGLAAEPTVDALHLEGNPDARKAWLVQVLRHDAPAKVASQSIIWTRSEGSKAWRATDSIPTPVAQVTHLGDQLVALLANGDWQFVGQSTGRPLPDSARIIALAGDRNALWALGRFGAPSTQSAATQSAVTQPAGTQHAPGLGLYLLERGDWVAKATLPADLFNASIAMGMVASHPTVAIATGSTLQLQQFEPDGEWADLGAQPIAPGTRALRLLETDGRIFIYVANDSGSASLLVRADKWLAPVPLTATSPVRTLGEAGGMLRFIYADGTKLQEQRIDPRTAKLEGPPAEVPLPRAGDTQDVAAYIKWATLVIVALVMFHTYQRRDRYQKPAIDWQQYQTAPLLRRLLAALIDLIPFFAASFYLGIRFPSTGNMEEAMQAIIESREGLIIMGVGVLAYVLHTAITEMIAGRSVGKMACGLYVIGINGKTPSKLAFLVRNLLRPIDMQFLIVLALIAFLPLRQRIGDLAGGTVVVAKRKIPSSPQSPTPE